MAGDVDELVDPLAGEILRLTTTRTRDIAHYRSLTVWPRCSTPKPYPDPSLTLATFETPRAIAHTTLLTSYDPPPSASDPSSDDGWFGDRGQISATDQSLEPSPGRAGASAGASAGGGRRVLQSVALVVVLGAMVGAVVAVWGFWRFNEIAFVDVPGVEPPADGGAVNWLLVGTDGREGIDPDSPNADAFLGEQIVGKRTDTIMVVRIDAAADSVDLLSVPRDLWVPIAGRADSGRINGAYNGENGRQRLVATLSGALDLEIHHYAEINFVGFAEIVDALEGVPLWFEHPARDIGSGLDIAEAGCHSLDGTQALAYARSRSFEELIDGQWRLDPTADLGRTGRQRHFLSGVITTATGRIGVSQLGTVDEVLAVGGRNLLIEDGATVADMVSLARTFSGLDPERIFGHSLPVRDTETASGAQVLELIEGEAQAVLEIFRDGRPPASPVVDGLNDPASPTADDQGDDSTNTAEPDGNAAASNPGYGSFGFTASPTPDGTACQ